MRNGQPSEQSRCLLFSEALNLPTRCQERTAFIGCDIPEGCYDFGGIGPEPDFAMCSRNFITEYLVTKTVWPSASSSTMNSLWASMSFPNSFFMPLKRT